MKKKTPPRSREEAPPNPGRHWPATARAATPPGTDAAPRFGMSLNERVASNLMPALWTPNASKTSSSRIGIRTGVYFRTLEAPVIVAPVLITSEYPRERLLLSTEIAEALGELATPCAFYLAADTSEDTYLIPIELDQQNRPPRSGVAAREFEAVLRAATCWTRIDKVVGGRAVTTAVDDLGDQALPDHFDAEIELRNAFGNEVVTSLDDPRLDEALGRRNRGRGR